MTTVDVGPFRLVDPPPGQEAVVRAAIAAIDYPWARLAPALASDPDRAVIVEWDDTGQGTSGLFYGYSLRIVLSTRSYHLDDGAAFVFAHEVGHLVDRADLTDESRVWLTELMHDSPETHRYDGQSANGGEHYFSHHVPHSEDWVSPNDYLFRLNEAYADIFVAAFAPTIWDGSVLPGAGRHGQRFIHSTTNHDEVVRLTLWDPPTPDPRDQEPEMITLRKIRDVTRRHPKADAIVRAVNLGLLDLTVDRRFYPGRRVTRAQLAEALVRLHDKGASS